MSSLRTYLLPSTCHFLFLPFNLYHWASRPFRYDLNQIPNDYTVEVRNWFKGLDLIGVPDELWAEVHDIVQEIGIKTIPQKKKCKKAKWLSEEALQIAVKRREAKKQRRKGKIYAFERRVPKNSKER